MPALLSPRGSLASAKASDEEPVKKSKGVMGRIKSTFKLGRRKSSEASSTASAAAAAASAVDEKDQDDVEERTVKQENDLEGRDQHVSHAYAPMVIEEKTEIKQFNAAEEEEEEERITPQEESSKLRAIRDADANDTRVATFELPAMVEEQAKPDESDEDKETEEEEVFACDYKSGDGPQQKESKYGCMDDEDEVVEVFADDGSSNQDVRGVVVSGPILPSAVDKDFGAPHESDLVVVGVSPAKFRVAAGPSVSPIKRSQPPAPQRSEVNEAKVATPSDNQGPFGGPSEADAQQSLGDRVASAHSTRPTRQAPVLSSPSQRSQLLSDFQFGTEGAAASSHSPVPSSPMKRRGSSSQTTPPTLHTRRSFQREQEQQLSVNASAVTSPSPASSPNAKRKPDTPSTIPSVRASRPERRQSLHGIDEEEAKSVALEEVKALPPRPSAGMGRRRSMNTDAPILASSFVATAPEIHDDHMSVDEKPMDCALDNSNKAFENEDEVEEEIRASAFAFDAGAAITQEFGERVARLLGADPWGDRQDGFDAILYQIKKTDLANANNKRELFCAAVAAVQCGVEDRVAPVMYCALECLRGVLKEYAPVFDRTFLKYQPMNEQLSGLTRAIVNKLGDSNKRTQRESSQAVLRLAKLKKLKTLPHVLLHLSAKEVAPRQRVETLRLLVNELGVDSKTAMNVEVVMQFAVPVLKIADEKTRKAAVELIAELHLINGQAVNAQLTGVKPEMLRVINRRVDELMAKREEERQQQQQQVTQNANQAEESNDDGDAPMELVAVPVDDSKAVQGMLETVLGLAQNVVGPVTWRKLESKTWSDRKEALVDVEKTITEAKSDLRDVKPAFNSVVQNNFAAYCTVVYKCLSDSIAPVVNSTMDCFSTLIKIYGPCVEWREEVVRDMTLLTIMRLFSTMQKPNKTTTRAACRCILKLTRLSNPHTLRYAISCVFAKETDALVQMTLLRLLIPELGFQPDGISANQVLDLAAAALNNTNDKVRKIAADVALCTQRLVGKDLVLKKLKDAVKPVVLKELEKNFVDVDAQKSSERPKTVHATAAPSSTSANGLNDGSLPPVQFGGERRLLNSAPVGLGKLQCTPPTEDDLDGFSNSTAAGRRASVLSNEEENLMDSILGSDDF